jgi:predicted dehydrogenase
VTEGRPMLDLAAELGLRVGSAPDTVLGTGIQTARQLLDAGTVGSPVSAAAAWSSPGHERWHPAPAFYYQPGGGPLLDMGPYYLTSLVHLLGPVRRVVGASSRPKAQRTIGDGPKAGQSFDVVIDTHITGILEHEGGALTTLIMSFDTWAANLPRIEVYGSAGSLSVPDPNYFDGEVQLFTGESGEWAPVPVSGGYLDAARGYGLADLALALDAGKPHRASVEVGLHVLDVMESVQASAADGRPVTVATTCERPERIAGLIALT